MSGNQAIFSQQEKEDLRDLFRVYDFGKFKTVEDVIQDAEEKKKRPSDLFNELYDRYRIKRLDDRAGAFQRLRNAVPGASENDVESALRIAEIKSFSEADALRSLQRQFRTAAPDPATHGKAQTSAGAINTFQVEDTDGSEKNHFVKLRSVSGEKHADPSATAAVFAGASACDRFSVDHIKTEAERNAFVQLRHLGGDAAATSCAVAPSTEVASQDTVAPESHEHASLQRTTNAEEDTTATTITTTATAIPSPSCLTSAPKRESLDKIMAEDIRAWIAAMVGDAYNSRVLSEPNFVDSLRDGVVLHVLIQKMRTPPVEDAALKIPKRTVGFFARDNVATFLQEARQTYGLLDAQTFTDSDLCDGKDDRQVITCLMCIARAAYARGTITVAPEMVVFEREVEKRSAATYTDSDLQKMIDESEAAAAVAAAAPPAAEGVLDSEESSAVDVGATEAERIPVAEDTTEEAVNEEVPDVIVSVEDALKKSELEESARPEESKVPARDASQVAEGAEEPVSLPSQTLKEEDEQEAETVDARADTEQTQDVPATDRAKQMAAEEAKKTTHSSSAEGARVLYVRNGELREDPDKPVAPFSREAVTRRVVKQTLTYRAGGDAKLAPRYISHRWDLIDVALGNVINAHYKKYPSSPLRVHSVVSVSGEYVINNRDTAGKFLIFVRLVQGQLLVRRPGAAADDLSSLHEYLESLETTRSFKK